MRRPRIEWRHRGVGGIDEQGRRKGRGGQRVRDDRRGSCKWRRSADRGIRDVQCQDPTYLHRAQPPDRRGNFDIGVEVSLVQGGEGAQGCSERRRDAVTAG